MIDQWLGWIGPSFAWGLLGLALAVAELIAPGIFLVWIALAAGLTAGLSALVPMAPPFQFLAFAIFSVLSVSGGRLWYLARPTISSDPKLNDPAARMIGRTVIVAEAILHGEGRVKVDDSSWRATGPDAPVGAQMTVLDVHGSTLVVGWLAA